jgi:hypothetical protein
MISFMDYAKGDVSRPAAIPGWTGIDYSTGPSHAGQFWLNQVDMDGARFRDYRQVLDMHDGTLTTRYRYLDGRKATDIQVVSLVSQASPHLAASQFSITPDFDGEVQLSFALDLWAPHQPRFALGEIDGPQMQEAVAAHNLKLKAVPPDVPDRAPLWYHGDTHVLAADGDTKALTLWLDGKAEQGHAMAQAVAIALPAGMQPRDVRLHHTDYRLSLELRVAVQKGKTYAFTKFVAASRERWGGDAKQDLALATGARNAGFDALLQHHRDAWHALWQSDIVIDGDPKSQQIVHSDLYYLLSNAAPNTAWPVGACGMTPGYTAHVFWDSDTWVFPALLLLHPDRAKSLVMFRSATLPAAEQRAKERGLRGAMYPDVSVGSRPRQRQFADAAFRLGARRARDPCQRRRRHRPVAVLPGHAGPRLAETARLAGDPRRRRFLGQPRHLRARHAALRDPPCHLGGRGLRRRAERHLHQRLRAEGAAHRRASSGADG